MEQERAYTSTPWYFDGEYIITKDKRYNISKGFGVIAGGKSSGSNWEEDAAFIVHAVNNYRRLYMAVKVARDYMGLTQEQWDNMGYKNRLDSVMARLNQAIENAEGKQ